MGRAAPVIAETAGILIRQARGTFEQIGMRARREVVLACLTRREP
jgi:hypothetical protein